MSSDLDLLLKVGAISKAQYKQLFVDLGKARIDETTGVIKEGKKVIKNIERGYSDDYVQYTVLLYEEYDEDKRYPRVITRKGIRYGQIYIGTENWDNVDEEKDVEKFISKLDNFNKYEKLIKKLRKNKEFRILYDNMNQSAPVHAVFLMKPTAPKSLFIKEKKEKKEKKAKKTKVTKEEKKRIQRKRDEILITNLSQLLMNDLENSVIMSHYVDYELNDKAIKFGDLFKQSKLIEENWKANSCYINIILETYKQPFEKLSSEGKNLPDLTYESLCKIFEIENKNQDIGLSITQSLKFFNQFRLGIDVVDIFGEIIFRYRPEKLNAKIRPQVLRVVIYNNHVYRINKNIKSLSKIDVSKETSEVGKLKITNRYKLREFDEEKKAKIETYFVDKLEDVTKIIKKDPENQCVFLFRNTIALNNILFEIVNQHKVIPGIKIGGNKILSVNVTIGEKKYTISRATDNSAPNDRDHIIDEKSYDTYMKADENFYKAVMRKELLSEYPDCVREIEAEYPIGPMAGYFTKTNPNEADYYLHGIDMCKAYPSSLVRITHVPVFDYFDRYTKYDGKEEINPYYMYIVKAYPTTKQHLILFPHVYERAYGFRLLKAQAIGITFDIRYVRKYSRLVPVDFKTPMDELFAIDEKTLMTENDKKYIANKTIGLMEKRVNKVGITKVFKSYSEAQSYQIIYHDKGFETSHIITIDDRPEDMDKEDENYYSNLRKTMEPKYMYLLYVYKEEELTNSFRQIKEMVYDIMKARLYDLYQKCTDRGLDIVGIKTDCVLLSNTEEEITSKIKLNNKFGGLKLEKGKNNKPLKCINKKIRLIDNELKLPDTDQVKNITIEDEYNKKEFKEVFDNHNRILIKSTLPGCGKSQAVKNYSKDTLFVCPYNVLALGLKKAGFHSVTAHSLLGICLETDRKTAQYDVSQYSCICFDEALLHNSKMLRRIDQYINNHPDIKFFATGDTNQNEPIGDDDEDEVDIDYDKLIGYVFNNQITLKTNKRLKDEEQKEILASLRDDILDVTKPIMPILEKHFKVITKYKDIKTNVNVAYSNKNSDMINNIVHNKQQFKGKAVVINETQYFKGMNIICRKRLKTKGVQLFTNYTYTIKKIRKNDIDILEEFEDKTFTIDHHTLEKHFKLPYCRTGHSIQGITINEPITIFECDSPYVNRKWVWTAITRTTDLNDITIFKTNDKELEMLKGYKRLQYLKLKIAGYIRQDKHAGREIDKEEYITPEWFYENLQKQKLQCLYCKEGFYATLADGKCNSNITADRKDNNIAHHQDNCVLSCTNCNRKRSDKNLPINI